MNTTKTDNPRLPRVEELKLRLQKVREASLEATRSNDYRKVAMLTAEAASLNRAILEAGCLPQV